MTSKCSNRVEFAYYILHMPNSSSILLFTFDLSITSIDPSLGPNFLYLIPKWVGDSNIINNKKKRDKK